MYGTTLYNRTNHMEMICKFFTTILICISEERQQFLVSWYFYLTYDVRNETKIVTLQTLQFSIQNITRTCNTSFNLLNNTSSNCGQEHKCRDGYQDRIRNDWQGLSQSALLLQVTAFDSGWASTAGMEI